MPTPRVESLTVGSSVLNAIMEYVTTTDVFAAGIGLDLAGAYLVARGLRRNPAKIKARNTWGCTSEGQVLDDANDRAWSDFGIPALVAGFSLQALDNRDKQKPHT